MSGWLRSGRGQDGQRTSEGGWGEVYVGPCRALGVLLLGMGSRVGLDGRRETCVGFRGTLWLLGGD